MATISTLSAINIFDARVELNKVTRRDGIVSRYEVEFVEQGFSYTLFKGISEASSRMWYNTYVKEVKEGWRP